MYDHKTRVPGQQHDLPVHVSNVKPFSLCSVHAVHKSYGFSFCEAVR